MIQALKTISSTLGATPISLELRAETVLHCWTCTTHSGAFILSTPISTKAEANAYQSITQEIDKEFKKGHRNRNYPLRLMACLLCHPETEWNAVEKQELWLTWLGHEHGLSAQMKQVILPSDTVYIPRTEARESEFLHKAVDRLSLIYNVDAWETYCFWITEEMEMLLANAHYDDIALYTLEGLLKDFIIEERASILRHSELDVDGMILKLGALRQEIDFPTSPGDEIFSLEKRLVKARSETKQRLIIQYHTLQEIIRTINIIESAHHELLSLKRKTQLLSLLMGSHLELEGVPLLSWGQQLMIQQLLHEEIGVVSAINCPTGTERTSLAFAVQLATSLLKQEHGVDNIIAVAERWDGLVEEMNKQYVKMGTHGYFEWLKQAPEMMRLADQMRLTIVAALDQLCVPINPKHPHPHWHEERKETLSYLSLLPPVADLHDSSNKKAHVHIIHLDPMTGQPTGLSHAGHFLMSRLRAQ